MAMDILSSSMQARFISSRKTCGYSEQKVP